MELIMRTDLIDFNKNKKIKKNPLVINTHPIKSIPLRLNLNKRIIQIHHIMEIYRVIPRYRL